MKIQILKTPKQVKEFSKKFIAVVSALWIITAFYAGYIIFHNPEYLPALLEYIGAPMTGGIILYMVKSAFENREKIKRSSPLDNQNEPEQQEP